MTTYKPKKFPDNHLSSDDLLKYHRRQLAGNEYTIIENHILHCELCADALKGIPEMDNAKHIYSITHELKKRMKKRSKSMQPIFSKFYIFSLLLVFFIIGLILFLAFYFIIVKR